MNIDLKENERIDDLERNGLKIIQNSKGFCFGMDAVLLSGFAAEKLNKTSCRSSKEILTCPAADNESTVENESWMSSPKSTFKEQMCANIIDLGTGTGILPLLLYAKTKAEHITGLEIQKDMAEMAERSVRLNDLEHRITIVHGDIKEASDIFTRASFDAVTSNPPYIRPASGIVNPKSSKAIARHEVSCTFEDVAKQTALLLKPHGSFFLVHRPQRLAEIIVILKKYKLEPKRMRLVHSFADSEATLVLIESVRGGNSEMKVEKPLVIYKSPGVYTEEIVGIYGF